MPARDGFGAWLRSWRHAHRETQQSLAESLGYDVTYVAKIEGGSRPPSRQFLARLSQVADLPPAPLAKVSADDLSRPELPAAPDRLVGREAEAAEVVGLFSSGTRCVTITGPPGMGKTRLASEVAHRMDSVLLSGAWWVGLSDLPRPEELVTRILASLGSGTGPATLDHLVDRLASHQALLVLDNFEHVIAGRHVVGQLVARLGDLSILVTSRERLGLLCEQVFPLRPLALPGDADHRDVARVGASPAAQLLVARRRMSDPDFRLDASTVEQVARACTDCEGIPLLIVLAAGSLGRGPGSLEQEFADLPDRHRSLDAALELSWRLLEPMEAKVLAALAVFAGGADPDAAVAVVSEGSDVGSDVGSAVGSEEVMGALRGLVRKSLIEEDDQGRYRLLRTVQAFAAARLDQLGMGGTIRASHAGYFTRRAEQLGRGLVGRGQAECLDGLGRDMDNLATAMDHLLETDPDRALAMAASLWRYFLVRDIPTGARWLERALAAAPAPSPVRADALAAAGALAWVMGRSRDAQAHLGEALALAEASGRRSAAALAWLNLGAVHEQRGDLDEAHRCFSAAEQLSSDLGDGRARACALIGHGVVWRDREEISEACRCWIEALALLRQAGDRFTQTLALGNLAWAAEREERIAEALDWLADARRIHLALGDARGLSMSTAVGARLHLKAGELTRAEAEALEALESFHRLGDHPWVASTLIVLSVVRVRQGQVNHALRLAGAAEGLMARMGATWRSEDVELRAWLRDETGSLTTDGELERADMFGRTLEVPEAVALAREGPGASE